MKFKIRYRHKLGYYSLVKLHWFSPWRKIGKHTTGFGLYLETDIYYPMKHISEAELRIEEYQNRIVDLAYKPIDLPYTKRV